MNAASMTFGIEIETMIPINAPFAVGPHRNGYPIPQLRGQWKADADPSIEVQPGYQKCEFVSPVFTGIEGLKQLVKDLETIKAFGAKVNSSCGIHIHVGADKRNRPLMEKIASIVANFETAIYASTGTKSRELGRIRNGGRQICWCKKVSTYGSPDRFLTGPARGDRYHLLNITSEQPTVEFRPFAGSLNVSKIVAYVRMCVGIVEKAANSARKVAWTPTPVTGEWRRAGEGVTQTVRLSYFLGWNRGREPKVYGDLTADGVPSIEDSNRIIRKMATKYDQSPATIGQ